MDLGQAGEVESPDRNSVRIEATRAARGRKVSAQREGVRDPAFRLLPVKVQEERFRGVLRSQVPRVLESGAEAHQLP